MANNPVQLVSQNFYKELSTAPVNWLLANAGDKIRVETTFSVSVYAMSDSNNQFVLNNNDGFIGAGWIQDPQAQFGEFNVGDSVTLYDYTTNALVFSGTILAKKDDGNIQLSSAIASTPAGTLSGTVVLSLTNAITGFKYHYNMIKNSAGDTFTSSVDGVSEQVIVARNKSVSDTSATAMEALGALTWQDGQAGFVTLPFGGGSTVPVATIQGVSTATIPIYVSTFKIIHYTKVSPYLLYNMTVPPYTDTNCLKFITKIEALQAYDNPNLIYSSTFDSINGNVGWENENFTTGKTNYSISNVTYSNSGSSVGALVLNSSETTLTFNINNTVDSPFSNNNTQFVLNFFKVPADASEYQGTGNLMDVNFLYDRVMQTVGSSAVNGDNYGGTYQVLKSVSATYVSASQILVTAKFDMSAAVLAGFNASSLPQYKLTVITQNYTKATNVSDLVTLVVDSQPFTVITSDPRMIVFDPTVFLRHPEADPTAEGVVVGNATGGAYATLSYDVSSQASAWSGTGSIALFLDPISTTFYFGSSRSWASGSHTNLNDAMNDIVAQINASAGLTVATYNTSTHKLFIQAPIMAASWNSCYIVIPAYSVSVSFGGPYFSGGVDPTYITLDVYPEDELVACTNFYIESSGRTSNSIVLQTVNAKIIASNGTSSFELDQFIMSLSGYPLIGYTQQFDAQVARAFHVPNSSIRKYIEVKRRNDLDTGTRKYFSSKYPFMWRWETWTAALGVDPSFFNASLPNNGFNQWWYQYAQLSGWSLSYEIIVKATENGTPQSYSSTYQIVPHDYRSNSAYTVKEALTFDPNGTTQLQTGGTTNVTIGGQLYYTVFTKQFMYSYKNTLAVAIFTKTSAPANVTVVLRLEIWQQGGIYGIRRFSSKWQADSDTWFTSVDQVNYPNKVKLVTSGNSIVATALINYLALPQNITAWKLSARIYEISAGIETDDGVTILNDNGVQITVD